MKPEAKAIVEARTAVGRAMDHIEKQGITDNKEDASRRYRYNELHDIWRKLDSALHRAINAEKY